eukprot:scaffold112313_cov87-Attheya_sp.AAC.1
MRRAHALRLRRTGTNRHSIVGPSVVLPYPYRGTYRSLKGRRRRNYESASFVPFREGQIGQMDGRWIE